MSLSRSLLAVIVLDLIFGMNLPEISQMAAKTTMPQANTPKAENIKVTLLAPQQGFRRYVRFNRFRINCVDEGKLLQVSFIVDAGLELCRYSAFVSIADLKNNVSQVSPYLGAIGVTPPGGSQWDQGVLWSVPSSTPMDMVRHFHLARSGQDAEISLFSFPFGAVLAERKVQQEKPDPSHSVSADPIALLSSSLNAHVALLVELFGEFLK